MEKPGQQEDGDIRRSKRNKASSFTLYIGGMTLCDRTRFRGPRRWMLGAPGLKGNLTDDEWRFNDRAESGWDW